MVVLFCVFAAVVVVLGVVDLFRPGRGARRSARATPSWLHDGGPGSSGGDAGASFGGFGDGGGCGGGDGGGGSSC